MIITSSPIISLRLFSLSPTKALLPDITVFHTDRIKSPLTDREWEWKRLRGGGRVMGRKERDLQPRFLSVRKFFLANRGFRVCLWEWGPSAISLPPFSFPDLIIQKRRSKLGI
ncbi:hypothetical protein SAY86_021777 [Trapa natans]|uniref:Uncharacterized protein n=1 Tax=Trapa natans TaxID=22666 RepID=A0AAN7RFV4_TRANT|nr:hypothetical protein SAY86_021777 [Trapa natans]